MGSFGVGLVPRRGGQVHILNGKVRFQLNTRLGKVKQ
jgi:hypothetical protein